MASTILDEQVYPGGVLYSQTCKIHFQAAILR